MPRILIIADDLTGANDTGVMIAQKGFRTCTVLDYKSINPESLVQSDCVSFSVDSRGIKAEDAYLRVQRVVEMFRTEEVNIYSKRIDSTLRGNLGAEMDAMLDALGQMHMAIIVPSFPRAGRIYTGGRMLVHGQPLHCTTVALDPKNPIQTDSALELFQNQTKYPMAEIRIEEIKKGSFHIAQKVVNLYENGVRGVICDAECENDCMEIAKAVQLSNIPFIAVDPGIFTANVVSVYYQSADERVRQKKMLFVIGSVSDIAFRQVQKLMAREDVFCTCFSTDKVLESEDSLKGEINRIIQEIVANGKHHRILCVYVSGIFPENRINLQTYAASNNTDVESVSSIINNALAKAVDGIMAEDSEYRGLFCCGGDVSIAVCHALKAYGIWPIDDVIPLVVYGHIAGGTYDGMPIITKGGMIGDDDIMCKCIEYLEKKISEEA